ncbi:uncharacterized protein LOC127470206 isoform X4 [Manacus candei]|uniref:uncharacterized protein LOC127470206 isoform X4 n=1 Tax=Manacus candei TaxID=415023 RepID=UPI00222729BD|nr:uncharacterized protein LOC127470206 isoform X4 [Manacus candei]
MNCLPGNGRTGWTLDCSLWMCGSPLRNSRNSWCRLGRWTGRPSPSVPALPLGPCPVVALPALQWDVAWKLHRTEPRDLKGPTREVKKEGRREVRQQPSSTKCLCKQAEEPRPEMAECWCDPEWVSLPLGQSPELPLASPAEGWELPRASSIQLEDPGGCSSVFLGGKRWGCRSWQECFAGRGRAGAGELQVQQLCQCWMESGWERALSVRAGESPGWPWEPWGCEQVQWAKEWALESWANSWSSSKENQETGIREQQLPVCVCRTRCTAAPSEVGNEPQEAGNESYKLVKVGWTLPKCLKSCSSVLLY